MQLASGKLDRFDRVLAAGGKIARGVSLQVPKGGGWQFSVTFPPSDRVRGILKLETPTGSGLTIHGVLSMVPVTLLRVSGQLETMSRIDIPHRFAWGREVVCCVL